MPRFFRRHLRTAVRPASPDLTATGHAGPRAPQEPRHPDVSGAAYQASKRGLIGLAHAIRVEEKENGIRTCVICPGLVDTEILEKRPVKPGPEMLAKALQPQYPNLSRKRLLASTRLSTELMYAATEMALEEPAQETQITAEVCWMVCLYYAQLRRR